jgi:hypothetical protein
MWMVHVASSQKACEVEAEDGWVNAMGYIRLWRTEGGDWRGVNGSQIKILSQKTIYVPSLNPKVKTLKEGNEHTNQQCRNDPLKVMNVVEKEWDQLDIRLARYGQNHERTSG